MVQCSVCSLNTLSPCAFQPPVNCINSSIQTLRCLKTHIVLAWMSLNTEHVKTVHSLCAAIIIVNVCRVAHVRTTHAVQWKPLLEIGAPLACTQYLYSFIITGHCLKLFTAYPPHTRTVNHQSQRPSPVTLGRN